MNATIAPDQSLHSQFARIVGEGQVIADEGQRKLFSEDVWSVGEHVTRLIVAPRSVEEISAVMRLARKLGLTVVPRGAGMSYTSGYLPPDGNSISLDMAGMDRVIAVSPEDMTVTVEAGCSWLKLNQALDKHGLRTPFWGPMSGIASTIGGGLSNLNAMFGAGHHGTSSESVIALTVVLADGSIIRTGARGPDGDTPFYRHYGPDLAGIFCGDAGAFGIKAVVTFRLMRKPRYEDYASFSFKTGQDMLKALAEIARAGIACETCGFDPGLTKVRMRRMSLMSDIKTLSRVVGKQGNMAKGLFSAAKIALGGRNFIEEEEYPLHIIAEGRSREGVAQDMREAREIAKRFDGVEIENTIAKVIRADPFPVANSVLGPEGESWVPVHGHVSLSNAPLFFAEVRALFDSMADEFAGHGVHTGFLFSSLSTNAITIEPVFYWPKPYRPIHQTMVEPSHLARLPQLGANAQANADKATAVVTRAREGVKDIARKFGAAHFQIGRSYDYRASRDEASKALLDRIKQFADPDGKLNTGSLGFQ